MSSHKAPAFFYDERDRVLNVRLSAVCLGLAVTVVLQFGLLAWLVARKPDRLVVAESPSGRVVVLDGRSYAKADGVTITEDAPTDADKLYCTYLFTDFTQKYDAKTLGPQFETASAMFTDSAVRKFASFLKKSKVLETRIGQGWESRWEMVSQELQPDGKTVRLTADIYLRKLVGGDYREEKKQVELLYTLLRDPRGRCPQNRRTGFLIAGYQETELKGQSVTFPFDPIQIEETTNAANQPQPSNP